MTSANRHTHAVPRLVLAALVLVLGAYWAGSRWGQRQPIGVEALPPPRGLPVASAQPALVASNLAARDAALTDEEAINVRV